MMFYTRGFVDQQGWTRLNEATNSVLPDYDDEEQTDIMDGDKGGRAANAHSLWISTID